MKGRSFVVSAIILALGGFFAKAIGALYKIPLTNILGSNGIGLYYLIFPIYSLVITFCSSGLSVALATEVAKCRSVRNRYNEQKIFRIALVISFILSAFFTIVILLLSRVLAEAQGNINAHLGYIAIAPAIILSSIISTVRGYFQGIENMVPTTISLIVEQIVKLTFGLILAKALCNYGIQYAVLGAIIGVSISEVVALVIIVINFVSYKGQLHYNYRNLNYRSKRNARRGKIKHYAKVYMCGYVEATYFRCGKNSVRYSTVEAVKKLLKVFIPTTFSSIIIPISTMIDSFVIINLLVHSGYTSHVSTILYGLWGGVVQSLISLPTILIAGISTCVVPTLSGVIAGRQDGGLNRKITFFIKVTFVLALIMFALIFVFAEDILVFLYGDGLSQNVIDELFYATKMLRFSSISIIYYAFLQTFTAILQAVGKSQIPLLAMIVGVVVRILLTIWLVKVVNINIFGAIVANMVFLILSDILLAIYIRGKGFVNSCDLKQIFQPLLALFLSIFIMFAMHQGLSLIINYFFSMMISGLVGLVVYTFIVYFGVVFDIKEKREYFKFKQKLHKNNCKKMGEAAKSTEK